MSFKETVPRIAIVTGEKSHDAPGLRDLFRQVEPELGIKSYVQHLDDFASAPEEVRDSYSSIIFYFCPKTKPDESALPGYCGRPLSAIERITKRGQGIVVLHHALLAYADWPVWDGICGFERRELEAYSHDEEISIYVCDAGNPITSEIKDFTLHDESYKMHSPPSDFMGTNTALLRNNHPDNIKTLAWTRNYANSRVFCFQSGHDRHAWENSSFSRLLARGIDWTINKEAQTT